MLRIYPGVRFAPRLVRQTFSLAGAVARGGNLLRPADTHQKTTGKFLQRSFALIVGQQKLTAQIIPKGFPHIRVRRRVSPNTISPSI